MTDMLLLAYEDNAWTRGGWANQTIVHPIGVAMLALCALATLFSPRKYAIIPFFFLMCVVARQRVSLLTMDWDFVRILIVVGWVRVLMRKEFVGFRPHALDLLVVAWFVTATLGNFIQAGNASVLLTRSGAMIDTLGAYFLFRMLTRSWEDVRTFIRGAAIIAIPIAIAFLVEKSTARNLFSVFGGVREITWEREGRLRCQGAFVHPILAGSFWAVMTPFFAALWFTAKDRALGVFGFGASLLIIFACSSSTPVAALGMVIIGWFMYLFRSNMTTVRWSVLGALVFLQVFMQKPVYHLISRIDLVGGSTGWHRYHLFDQFVRRWDEWFICGVAGTSHWGYGLHDVTNQYVLEGVRGGIVPLAFFVAMIVVAFYCVREILRAAEHDKRMAAYGWAIGVAIFANSMIFFAVSYFGQIVVLWHLTLALTASGATLARRSAVVKRRGALDGPTRTARRPSTRVASTRDRTVGDGAA